MQNRQFRPLPVIIAVEHAGKQLKLLGGYRHDAGGMTLGIPAPLAVLNAGDGSAVVALVTIGHRVGVKKVGDGLEGGLPGRAVHVHAIGGMVIYFRKQLQLVGKLEMAAQTPVQLLPQRPAFRVVVHAFGMHKPAHALGVAILPSLGQKALVQVGLLTQQIRVILGGVQEVLGARHTHVLL